MFSDRMLPPVSGGKRGRGNVSRIFIAIVLASYWEANATPASASLSGVKDCSFVPNNLRFQQATVTVQEYAVPKLEIQESPATFSGRRAAAAMRLKEMLH